MLSKPIPAVSPRAIATWSDASSGVLDQPLPTLKESEGLNSSERYSPGRRAFGSSGRGRAPSLLFASSAGAQRQDDECHQQSQPKSLPHRSAGVHLPLLFSYLLHATVAYAYEVEQRIPQMQYLLLARVA